MRALVDAAVRRVLACAVVVVVALTGHWLIAAGLAFVLAGLYWYSVKQMTVVPCWLCGGTGARSHRGLLAWLFPRVGGDCLRCHGDKVTQRWGARVLR